MNRPEILDAAKKCVTGQREQDYGSPERSFDAIADLWNAYLGKKTVDAVDVSMMLALLKIARIKTGVGTADSFVDLAGYAACGGEIATQEQKGKHETKAPADHFVKEKQCLFCGAVIPPFNNGATLCDACKEKLFKATVPRPDSFIESCRKKHGMEWLEIVRKEINN